MLHVGDSLRRICITITDPHLGHLYLSFRLGFLSSLVMSSTAMRLYYTARLSRSVNTLNYFWSLARRFRRSLLRSFVVIPPQTPTSSAAIAYSRQGFRALQPEHILFALRVIVLRVSSKNSSARPVHCASACQAKLSFVIRRSFAVCYYYDLRLLLTITSLVFVLLTTFLSATTGFAIGRD